MRLNQYQIIDSGTELFATERASLLDTFVAVPDGSTPTKRSGCDSLGVS